MPNKTYRRQRGVALITVFVVIAIATLLIYEMGFRWAMDVQRTEGILNTAQVYALALSVESVAMQGLIEDKKDDIKNNQEIDDCSSEEGWAIQVSQLYPLDDQGRVATIEASVQDLQGRFNLNTLVTLNSSGHTSGYNVNPAAVLRLQQLLRSLGIEASSANRIAEELADWLDSNGDVYGLDGAEDQDYQDYRTANSAMAHISEMRLLKSLEDDHIYEVKNGNFFSYFAALPYGTALNVNTAPKFVLKTLHSTLSDSDIESLIQTRTDTPFRSVDEFMAQAEIKTLKDTERNKIKRLIDVKSEYFQVVSKVDLDGKISKLVTQIYRPDQYEPKIIFRDRGQKFSTPEIACNPE